MANARSRIRAEYGEMGQACKFNFTDAALASIAATLPKDTPAERASLLPDLLRLWAQEDLRAHFSRDGRGIIRKRTERLGDIRKRASILVKLIRELDSETRFELAFRTQENAARMRSGQAKFISVDISTAIRRGDENLSWLCDVSNALGRPEPKPPPDRRTRSYLIVLDLAEIFELVTCTQPSRRNDPYADSQGYGPFWDFVNAICARLPGVKSIDRAIKDVMHFYPERERSAFVANLQFRHRRLWQKLKRGGSKICH